MNLKTIVLMATCSCAGLALGSVIDQRDKHYQMAIEHTSSAATAIDVAIEELKKAESYHPFPGGVISQLGKLQSVRDHLELILRPEKLRLEHKTLVPDSTFFKTPKTGDK